MIHGNLKWAAQAMEAHLESSHQEIPFRGVSTDTRALQPGEIFFCLVGERDGHEFAAQAFELGASAVVIDESHLSYKKNSAPYFVVKDTLRALGDLANAHRNQFSIPIIAIGGSNGKTTTKELVRNVLETRFRILATEGNFNNLIGVPKTLFNLDHSHEAAVIEVGMNDFGELARLTEICRPNAALLTNIGYEHLEKLGNLDGVAKAESELFAGLDVKATALINRADPYIAKMQTKGKTLPYGTPESKIWGEVLLGFQTGQLRVQLHLENETEEALINLPGAHNLLNVVAAVAVGHYLEIPLHVAKRGLETFRPAPSRMQLISLENGQQVLDDCYNSNPSSALAALKTLASLKGNSKSMAILGEMRELGEFTEEGHRQVGRGAALAKTDFLIAIGPHAQLVLQSAWEAGMPRESTRAFSDTEAAIDGWSQWPKEAKWVLVKGSRSNHLEKLIRFLKEYF